jgi:hypothetical protein
MRQALNEVYIEGILLEKNIETTTWKKDGKDVEALAGKITVEVPLTIDGEEKNLEIEVHMFANKYKKGTTDVSTAYTAIENVKNDFVSAAMTGSKETADKVRISKAQIKMNEYPGKSGEIVSYPRIYGNFVNRVTGNFNPRADFSLEFVLGTFAPVLDKEGVEVEPKQLKVTAVVPGYGDTVDIIPMIATKPNIIDGIETHWEKDNTYKVNGYLMFTSESHVIKEEAAFGDASERVVKRTISDLVIKNGTEAYEGEFAFDIEEVAMALKRRAAALEEKKNAKKATANLPSQNGGRASLGF